MDGLIALPELGRHGVFVWSAFALTVVVLVGLFAASVRALKSRETLLARLNAARGAEPAERAR